VFHEASHFLSQAGSPLSTALISAAKDAGVPVPDDVPHEVQFFMTGEAVRREFGRGGDPSYTPYLFSLRLFSEPFRLAIARTWPAYMDGRRTLSEAAADLVRALNGRP
jgi:hypothetical protein